PRDGPPASSSEGGYAPLGLPRPTLGAPRGTRGAPRSSACSSIVVGGPEMAPQPLQAKGATPPSDSPGRCSERPGEPVALLDLPRAHRSSWGAPRGAPPPPPPPPPPRRGAARPRGATRGPRPAGRAPAKRRRPAARAARDRART